MDLRESFQRQLDACLVVNDKTQLFFACEDSSYRLKLFACTVGDLDELAKDYEVEELADNTTIPFLRRKIDNPSVLHLNQD
jgi:hypothetical protein